MEEEKSKLALPAEPRQLAQVKAQRGKSRARAGTIAFGLTMLVLGILIGLVLDRDTVAQAMQQDSLQQEHFESILKGAR